MTEQLTLEEVAKLRKLIDHVDQIEAEMELKAAKRLVMKASRTLILGVASIVVALAVTWDKVEAVTKWAIR
jgi:hypothetical protein